MANLPISQLPSASIATGTNVLPIVQGGVTDQITVTNLGQGIFNLGLPITASSVSASSLNVTGNAQANKFIFTNAVINQNNLGQNLFGTDSNILYLYTGNSGLRINNQVNNTVLIDVTNAGAIQTRGALTVGIPGDDKNIIFGGTGAGLYWSTSGASIFYSNGALQFSSVGSSNNMILQQNGGAVFNYGVTGSFTGSLNEAVINNTAWISYTPNWTSNGTQPSLGNGELTGNYKVIGKTCFVRLRLALGTTSTGGTGHWLFSLPISASNPDGVQFPCSMLDNGNAWYQGTVNGTYAGHVEKTAIIVSSGGGASSSEAVTSIKPFTWGAADSLQFNGSYEIA